jgi:hypothetical protein
MYSGEWRLVNRQGAAPDICRHAAVAFGSGALRAGVSPETFDVEIY